MADSKASRTQKKALMIAVGMVVLLFAALPTAMLLAVGLVPTIVALIVDVTPGRFLARCVGGMNVAGVVPFVHKLWLSGHTMAQSFAILTDVYTWLVIYSAAGIGWLLFLGLPGAVAIFRQLNAKRRIYALREQQRALLAEWGDSILPPGEGKKSAAAKGEDGDEPAGRKGRNAGQSALEGELARRAAAGGR